RPPRPHDGAAGRYSLAEETHPMPGQSVPRQSRRGQSRRADRKGLQAATPPPSAEQRSPTSAKKPATLRAPAITEPREADEAKVHERCAHTGRRVQSVML